jgi:hypothetical protein
MPVRASRALADWLTIFIKMKEKRDRGVRKFVGWKCGRKGCIGSLVKSEASGGAADLLRKGPDKCLLRFEREAPPRTPLSLYYDPNYRPL